MFSAPATCEGDQLPLLCLAVVASIAIDVALKMPADLVQWSLMALVLLACTVVRAVLLRAVPKTSRKNAG